MGPRRLRTGLATVRDGLGLRQRRAAFLLFGKLGLSDVPALRRTLLHPGLVWECSFSQLPQLRPASPVRRPRRPSRPRPRRRSSARASRPVAPRPRIHRRRAARCQHATNSAHPLGRTHRPRHRVSCYRGCLTRKQQPRSVERSLDDRCRTRWPGHVAADRILLRRSLSGLHPAILPAFAQHVLRLRSTLPPLRRFTLKPDALIGTLPLIFPR